MISIHIDYAELLKAQTALKKFPQALKKAQKMATRRALETMRTQTARLIPDKYYVKPNRVRKSITLKMNDYASGYFMVTGRRMSLSNFYMTPKKIPVKRGLKVAVRRDTGIKSIPKGFLIRASNGMILPFIRTGHARKNIQHLMSPAIPQMIEKNPEIQDAVLKSGEEAFMKNFSYWVNQAMKN